MARKKKPTHRSFESNNEHGRFAKITIDMMNSPAWRALSVYEVALYLAIKSKYKGVNKSGQDNSRDLSFTHAEGQLLMSKARFIKAIDRLIATGFIDLIEHFPQSRRPTIYGLSDRWRDYGKPEFKEQARVKSRCPYKGGARPKERFLT